MVINRTRPGENPADDDMEPVSFRYYKVEIPSRKQIMEEDLTETE